MQYLKHLGIYPKDADSVWEYNRQDSLKRSTDYNWFSQQLEKTPHSQLILDCINSRKPASTALCDFPSDSDFKITPKLFDQQVYWKKVKKLNTKRSIEILNEHFLKAYQNMAVRTSPTTQHIIDNAFTFTQYQRQGWRQAPPYIMIIGKTHKYLVNDIINFRDAITKFRSVCGSCGYGESDKQVMYWHFPVINPVTNMFMKKGSVCIQYLPFVQFYDFMTGTYCEQMDANELNRVLILLQRFEKELNLRALEAEELVEIFLKYTNLSNLQIREILFGNKNKKIKLDVQTIINFFNVFENYAMEKFPNLRDPLTIPNDKNEEINNLTPVSFFKLILKDNSTKVWDYIYDYVNSNSLVYSPFWYSIIEPFKSRNYIDIALPLKKRIELFNMIAEKEYAHYYIKKQEECTLF